MSHERPEQSGVGLEPATVEHPASPRSAEAADPLLGRVVAGRFQIEAFIGQGACGRVYRAHHLALDKPVAIKVLRATSPRLTLRFHAEARAASRIDHPNSLRVYDFGDDDGLSYLAMELLDGEELRSILTRAGRLSSTDVTRILVQVAAVLTVAHRVGIVHRDLKPGNIMLVRRDELGGAGGEYDFVKVCDFGLAKLVGESLEDSKGAPLTLDDVVIGTPAYMSPEQAMGGVVDGRSDVYACGVLMYELLSGEPPFRGSSPTATLVKQITEPPVRIEAVVPDVDPRLAEVVHRCLGKTPEERFPSSKALLEALRAVLEPGLPEVRVRGASVVEAALDPRALAEDLARDAWGAEPPGGEPVLAMEPRHEHGSDSKYEYDSEYELGPAQLGDGSEGRRSSDLAGLPPMPGPTEPARLTGATVDAAPVRPSGLWDAPPRVDGGAREPAAKSAGPRSVAIETMIPRARSRGAQAVLTVGVLALLATGGALFVARDLWTPVEAVAPPSVAATDRVAPGARDQPTKREAPIETAPIQTATREPATRDAATREAATREAATRDAAKLEPLEVEPAPRATEPVPPDRVTAQPSRSANLSRGTGVAARAARPSESPATTRDGATKRPSGDVASASTSEATTREERVEAAASVEAERVDAGAATTGLAEARDPEPTRATPTAPAVARTVRYGRTLAIEGTRVGGGLTATRATEALRDVGSRSSRRASQACCRWRRRARIGR